MGLALKLRILQGTVNLKIPADRVMQDIFSQFEFIKIVLQNVVALIQSQLVICLHHCSQMFTLTIRIARISSLSPVVVS